MHIIEQTIRKQEMGKVDRSNIQKNVKNHAKKGWI